MRKKEVFILISLQDVNKLNTKVTRTSNITQSRIKSICTHNSNTDNMIMPYKYRKISSTFSIISTFGHFSRIKNYGSWNCVMFISMLARFLFMCLSFNTFNLSDVKSKNCSNVCIYLIKLLRLSDQK